MASVAKKRGRSGVLRVAFCGAQQIKDDARGA